MNKYIEKAKKCLNNENAGPNLENMIAFGFSIIVASAVFGVGRAFWRYLHEMAFATKPDLPEYTPIVGYRINQ